MLDSSDRKGVFEFRPLEPGYGITIGNAVRRVLLGSLEGYAICSVKISGIDHEFATIPGVITDVTNLILNLKQVRFLHKEGIEEETETVKLHVHKAKAFMAGEFNTVLQNFEVLNPELQLAELDERNKIHSKPLKGEQECIDILSSALLNESGCKTSYKWYTATEFIEKHNLKKYTSMQIGKCLSKLGYESKRVKIDGKTYGRYFLPYKEYISKGYNAFYSEDQAL
jgi:hypothetical protein